MKTNELEKKLGISKHTIMYYEKEGLLYPQRDENGYRNYQDEDIKTLEFILYLRNMDLSIDEIKAVLNKKMSIRDILEVKEDYLKAKEKELQVTKDNIQKHMERHKVNIAFDYLPIINHTHENLCFNHDCITFGDIKIKLEDIKEIRLLMCSEIYNINLLNLQMNYYVDIDIVTNVDTYSYQIMNDDLIIALFQYFHNHHITYKDPLELEKIYTTIKDNVQRHKYINRHFRKWAKKYHLDNPRNKVILSNQQDIQKAKDMIFSFLNKKS